MKTLTLVGVTLVLVLGLKGNPAQAVQTKMDANPAHCLQVIVKKGRSVTLHYRMTPSRIQGSLWAYQGDGDLNPKEIWRHLGGLAAAETGTPTITADRDETVYIAYWYRVGADQLPPARPRQGTLFGTATSAGFYVDRSIWTGIGEGIEDDVPALAYLDVSN